MLKTNKFKPFLLLSALFLLFFVLAPTTHALSEVNICNPPQTFFGKIRDFFKKDIRETTVNHLTSVAADFTFNMATGTEMGGWMGCTGYLSQKASCLGSTTLSNAQACGETDAEVCEGIYNQYINTGQDAVEFSGRYSDPLSYRHSATAGSLLGLGTSLDNYMHTEPLPVNFAYFFQDYAQRIPVVNQTAFAQTYQQPLVQEVLGVWKLIRNLAYGLMAIVIMVVGLLIITRRKINQQIVVTVQYALPKIVIAMLLITFSYPIGAAIASLSWAAYNSGNEIVTTLGGYSDFGCGQDIIKAGLGTAAVLVTGVIAILVFTGVGMFVTVFLIVVALAIIVAWLLVIIKAFITYLKMLIHVVVSPLYFVFGAIPGNDGQITNWFKKLAVYGISLFLMGLAQPMVILVASQFLFAITEQESMFTGVFYIVMAAPLIAIFGFIAALKIPGIVENAIMGSKRR